MVTKNTMLMAAGGMMAFALLAAGCGGAAEIVNEQLLENIEGVENVEIDQDTGEFEITIEQDGESVTIGGGEVPDGLTVPVADGGKVAGSATSDTNISVSLMYPGDQFDALVADYEAWADGSGLEVQKTENTFESDGDEIRNVSWSTDDGRVYVSVADCIDIGSGEFDSACVTISETT